MQKNKSVFSWLVVGGLLGKRYLAAQDVHQLTYLHTHTHISSSACTPRQHSRDACTTHTDDAPAAPPPPAGMHVAVLPCSRDVLPSSLVWMYVHTAQGQKHNMCTYILAVPNRQCPKPKPKVDSLEGQKPICAEYFV